MAKYSERVVKQIVELIEQDTFTTAHVCRLMQISRKTYYDWLDNKPEFREAIEKAKEHCEEQLLMNARLAMRTKLAGYTLTETVTTYVPDENEASGFRVKKRVVKTKEYPPNQTAIKQTLERNDKIEARKKSIELIKPQKSTEERVMEYKERSGFYDDEGNYVGRQSYADENIHLQGNKRYY